MSHIWRNYSFVIIFIVTSTIMGLVLIYSMIDEEKAVGHATVYENEQVEKVPTNHITASEKHERCSSKPFYRD